MLSYLSSSDAIYVANLVFGNDHWSSEVLRQEEDVPHREGEKWAVNAKCRVRVTVNWPSTGQSTFHEGTGYGGGSKGAKTPGDALEMAIKEAETDAFKRALRMFGEALGNCFYDKVYLAWIEKQRSREGKHDPSKHFVPESLLRKHATLTPTCSSQQVLSFEPRKSGNGAKVDGPVRLVPKTEEFDDVDSDMFVDDDGYTF
ncbi:rad52/22 family double-strand break repair protein domain-containing protein [Purpureocillium lilacinum]|uniref:Rad52/22 family double-strand break repair protein domain-containing protein n=1 Tax=Purpureocillium lilacinum TaxID=33203 RepID=A0A179EWF8_PURLI|nr:rad52/22 family double-strand break repair protein domain-containing protein [Purpureocillium lilacinum]